VWGGNAELGTVGDMLDRLVEHVMNGIYWGNEEAALALVVTVEDAA
jgi:hypothetical protein